MQTSIPLQFFLRNAQLPFILQELKICMKTFSNFKLLSDVKDDLLPKKQIQSLIWSNLCAVTLRPLEMDVTTFQHSLGESTTKIDS